MAKPLLAIEELSAGYGDVRVLWGIELAVEAGEIACIVGPNGAGKTTLLRTVSGLVAATAGRITFDGEPLAGASADEIIARGIAHVPEGRRLFRGLSVRENVEVSALGVGASGREAERRADALLERLGLAPYAGAPAAALAHGDERRLGVARALATEPSFVLLDEPAAGLPEAEVPDFAALVRSIAAEHGAGVLLIDHNMALIMETCDRIEVLDQGTVLAQGTPAEIRANVDVAAAYLGETPVPEE